MGGATYHLCKLGLTVVGRGWYFGVNSKLFERLVTSLEG